MSFRGVVRNGVVVFDNGVVPEEGTTVRVEPTRSRKKASPKARRKSGSRAEKVRNALDATFGIWKDRPEWRGMTTLEIQADLRRRAMGRRGG